MRFLTANRTRVTGLALAGSVVLAVGVVVLVTQPWQQAQSECDQFRDYVAEVGHVHKIEGGIDTDYTVLGDSISAGDGLDDSDYLWTRSLAGHSQATIVVDAIGDTGFVNAGPCGEHAFADRVDRLLEGGHAGTETETVFVQAGTEDVGSPPNEVEEAAASLIARLRAEEAWVVVIGPVDAPALDGEQEIGRALARAARDAKVPYISMMRLQMEFQSDGIHLTATGQDVFSSQVARLAADGD